MMSEQVSSLLPMFRRCPLPFILPALLLTALLPVTAMAAESLDWVGCGITKKAFMSEIAAAFEKERGIPVRLFGGGATKGIRAVASGQAPLGGTCRDHLQDADGAIIPAERNAGLVHVAWDALVAITHPGNPVENIDLALLKRVFDGEITSWKTLGGPDRRIVLITREGRISGVGHKFREMVFNNADHVFKARALTVKSSGQVEKKVEQYAFSLALDGISSARKRNVKILAIDGIAPDKEKIMRGEYPLFRPLFLAVNRANPDPGALQLIDFVLSPAGQAIIAGQGVVNLEEGARIRALWRERHDDHGLDRAADPSNLNP